MAEKIFFSNNNSDCGFTRLLVFTSSNAERVFDSRGGSDFIEIASELQPQMTQIGSDRISILWFRLRLQKIRLLYSNLIRPKIY
jgi:hypothetical protein